MTDTKNTFVILSPGFPAGERDSTCLPAHQVFVRALQKKFPSLNIIIIAFHYPYIFKSYKWNGIEVLGINGRNRGKLRRIITWIRVWRALKKIRNENNIIGVLSFWVTECALLGKYFSRTYKLKHYSWITGQDAKKGNVFIPFIQPKQDEIFAMSDFLATQFYINYKIKPSIVIPNGIDTSLFSPLHTERDIDILAAGSLIPLKQYDVFIEAVKYIQSQIADIKAILCGKGPEHEKLLEQVNQLSLQETIVFAGEKAHTDVLHLMQRSKVFLHTSNYEGFSTVCLEALYAGAHVISFFRPMEKDIPHWHIVATKEEMAETALALLTSKNACYKPVLAYAMDDVAKSVMQLYRN